MITKRLHVNSNDIEEAGEILRRGGLVAFPTETVYGLGADALNEAAVRSVYAAKGRPSDNPMIVHIADMEQLPELVTEIPSIARALMKTYWPGPITFVLKKSDVVPMVTTGGLDTVAIRMPSNETARRLIRAAKRPIAAPSANLSGRPSPTTALDVLEDMDGRIDAVIMGDTCDVGIESTVCDLTGKTPTILRPGYITAEMMQEKLGIEVCYDKSLFIAPQDEDFHPKSPGMKYKHYAPKANVIIVKGGDTELRATRAYHILSLALSGDKNAKVLDYKGDSREAAHDFFARLRDLDRQGVDTIIVTGLPEEGLGFSVMNRMLKAAGYNVVEGD